MAKKPSSKAKNAPDSDPAPKDDTKEDIGNATQNDASDETPDDTFAPAPEDTVEGAEASAEPAPHTAPDKTPEPDAPQSSAPGDDDAKTPPPDITGSPADSDTTGDADNSKEDVSLEDTVTGTSTAATLPATAPQPSTGPGAGSLILGGVLAGAIGFAAAYLGFATQTAPRDEALLGDVGTLGQRMQEQADTIDALAEKVGGITNTDDSALEAQIEALGTLSDRVAAAEEQLGSLDARLGDVEQGSVSQSADAAAVAAYEDELNAAREEIAAQRAELQAMIDKAMSTETAADEAAVSAMQRAAISRIQSALDSGTGFAGAVTELEDTGVEVPSGLKSVAEGGVATLPSLQETFPDAARAALDASRAVTGGGSGFTGFLRNQLGARSLEPREGSDPDAVLSRVEAAVRDGRLRDALAEMEELPEEGRAELSEWAGQAAQRLEAVGAAQSLSETLN
ncbi:MAG: COG4223 family protein [Roseovarius sp.]